MVLGTEECGVSDRDRAGLDVYRGHLDQSMVRNPEEGIRHGLRSKMVLGSEQRILGSLKFLRKYRNK